MFSRSIAALLASGIVLQSAASASAAIPMTRPFVRFAQPLTSLKLADGDTATVYADGIARIVSQDHRRVAYRALVKPAMDPDSTFANPLTDKTQLLAELSQSTRGGYAPNDLIVVFRDGIAPAADVNVIPSATLHAMRATKSSFANAVTPAYTNDAMLNGTLGKLGVDRTERLFRSVNRSTLSMMRTSSTTFGANQELNIANAYRLHLTNASVRQAIVALEKSPSVAYLSPNWYTGSMSLPPRVLPAALLSASQRNTYAMRRSTMASHGLGGATPSSNALPSNYALVSSGQSLLNTPSTDTAAAYDEIERNFNQLPGQGETITNVSLGDITDANAITNASDSCHNYASAYGPTMHLIGGQHYIDWPSFPLIPAYVSDASGNVSGTAEACGEDPQLVEIGIDFSMMAPLPHDLQRAGEQGSGMSDLLGIAPGAQYRLMVPSSTTIADVDMAFLAAALQSPRPTVITASLGFGLDSQGYASRYLEEDPLTEAVISSIVHSYHIVVCVSAGDGLRTATTAPIGPSGGSVPMNTVANGGTPTDLNDVAYSGAPSAMYDSGSIAVGGTTLDDLSAMPPQDPRYASFAYMHAFAGTRWTGAANYSSAFGTRVNVSAPGDNVAALMHTFGAGYDGVTVEFNGGTSAAAPQTAAAAAIALQVAKLTGRPFQDPTAVRSLLESTANAVPNLPQADVNVSVGPQIDVTRMVESLLTKAGKSVTPGVARVAVEQRRNGGDYDQIFNTDTDPNNISLQAAAVIGWITIAPDWEHVSPNAKYQLYVTGHKNETLAKTRWARLLPQTILQTAGQAFISPSNRTVNLTYEAQDGGKTVSAPFTLTFGPAAQSLRSHAPLVPPVVTTSIPIQYDLTDVAGATNLVLTVSEPGRVNAITGNLFHPIITENLRALKGTITIPVSSLQGGGIYGAAISFTAGDGVVRSTDYAYTRIQVGSKERPTAPLLAYNGSTPGHFAEVPYDSSFQVTYDVRNVSGATGAMLEVAAPGPGSWLNQNAFNNPNGSERDSNGIDAGSVYYAPVIGTHGTVTISGKLAGLVPTLYHSVRVIPMKFGAPAGEASDISTVQMDGVVAADGGSIASGYGVNAGGIDGYITSNQTTSSGEALGSVEMFDQTNMGIGSTIDSGLGNSYFTGGWGAWGGDVGLVGIQNSTGNVTYDTIDPITSGILGTQWNPPFPSSYLLMEGAIDNVDANGAFLVTDIAGLNPDRFHVFTSNLVADTFSTAYDISSPLAGFGFPIIGGMAENGTTKDALVAFSDADASNSCAAPTLVNVNLANGSVGTIAGVGEGSSNGVAIDEQSNKAGVWTSCDGTLGIYNLATGTAISATLPPFGYASISPIADEKHQLFLAMQFTAPDFATNNNALSQLDVMDENGNVLKTIEAFNTSGFFTTGSHYLQLNPNRRVVFFPGPGGVELEPMSY